MNKLMSFPEIVPELKSRMPELRGRLLPNQPLADLTWFRVGGLAQALFMPESEDDLAYFLAHVPTDVPATVIGLGSNLLVRDGGVPGVVIRLGKGFSDIGIDGLMVRAGAGAPDVTWARGVAGNGEIVTLTAAEMAFAYRKCGAPTDLIFTQACLAGRAGDPDEI